MLIYVANIIVTVLIAWVLMHQKKGKGYTFFVMTLFPIILSGIRCVGTDYYTFLRRYEHIVAGSFETTDISIIYFIMLITNKLGGNYQTFIFLISILMVGIAFYIFWELKDDINMPMAVFSYMLLWYQMSFSYYKQLLSAELFLLGLILLYKKSKKSAIIVFALSIMVHVTSSLYVILVAFLPHIIEKKDRKKRLLIYLSLGLIIISLPNWSVLIQYVLTNMRHWGAYFANFKYQSIGLGVIRYIILAAVPYCYFLIYRKSDNYEKLPSYMKNCLIISFIGAILWMTSYITTSSMYRISYTGLICLPIVHGYLCNMKTTLVNVIIRVSLIVSLIFFWWYDFFYLGSAETVPYHSIWG